ncbi:TPT domain-containing protein [Meloidogyne graminicola]|uniref:TPT domain-containing protein n=1 Tax=Meloidogyne graminicola TaxID=189291 RepID=A0A8S9ZN33_9BILA|nr:TPT domain-containing protein [Meloidogyne graminicola]
MTFIRKDVWFGIQIISICIFWWSSSSVLSILNKIALQIFFKYPFPLTIALSSCLNNALYALPLIRIFKISTVHISTEYLLKVILPISVGRAIGITSAYFALWKVTVSYAQTVKATMPIFTVLISRVLLGERQSLKLYFSLLPVVIGVFIASVTEVQFNLFGLFTSFISTAIFAFLNVLAKKVFDESGMHPISLLALNSQLATLLIFPFWVWTDGLRMWELVNLTIETKNKQQIMQINTQAPDNYFLLLLALSGLFSFFSNLCAFLLIHQLSTLSYAVTNATKRIFVIVLSLITLRNPVTPLNVFGMFISVFGVLIYNRVKSIEHESKTLTNRKEELFRRKEPIHVSTMKSSASDVRMLLD